MCKRVCIHGSLRQIKDTLITKESSSERRLTFGRTGVRELKTLLITQKKYGSISFLYDREGDGVLLMRCKQWNVRRVLLDLTLHPVFGKMGSVRVGGHKG